MAPKEPNHKTKPNPSLVSAIHSPQGLNPANMKTLFAALTHLVLRHPDLDFDKCKFIDIRHLSDILFQELDTRFKELFSALHDVSAHIWTTVEELTLLLRCCMVILILIASDQSLLIQKGRLLLSIYSRLISIEFGAGGGNDKNCVTFKKLVSHECVYVNDDSTTSVTEQFVACICLLEPSDPAYAFLCAALEVFADELLVHKPLRQYIMLIDSASPRSNMLFTCHFGHGNIASVLEVICAHFVLSVSDEKAFENFLSRLFWCHGEDFRIPSMSLTAAISLLLNPIILSAPKMFQAYVVLLVSEAIGICMPSGNWRPDLEAMECYSKAFEKSVALYSWHMSSLHVDDYPLGGNGSFVESCLLGSSTLPTFESLLQPATRDKLHLLIAKTNHSWDSYLSSMPFGTNPDLVAASIAYVKENLQAFDELYKDEVLSILSCIIHRGSSDDIRDTVLHNKGETSPQDIFLLASILKLMSSSMLQAIWYVKHLRFSSCLKSLEDVSSCKEYNAIVDIVSCFEQFNINLPVQKFLCEMMQSQPKMNKKSQWMLLHFSGLLSLSYLSGLDFIVKDCLFTLMTLLNLFIIEEGDLSSLGSLFRFRSESSSSKSSDKVEGALVVRKSSIIVSPRIQKIQEMYLRTRSLVCSYTVKQDNQAETSEYAPVLNGLDSALSVVDTKESCNGEIFLQCLLGRHTKRPSDFDELADFIECRPGKDYAGWLRDRQRFRLWKHKKMTILRWKKKKRSWNYLKGK